jgi:release factor glutamine methyltransferase
LNTQLFQEFRERLTASGYRGFYLALGDGNLRADRWEAYCGDTEDPLRGLVELFLLKRSLSAERVTAVLGRPLLEGLLEERILILDGGRVRTDGLHLIIFRSLLFFCEVSLRPSIYFGNDSIALGMYQTPAVGGISLDLCSGSSIQAMIAAQHSRKAYAVEINPKAALIAAFNVKLNGLEGKVEVINRSLEEYATQTAERFDRVTFNPPLLPIPEVLHYPFVGDGGEDGLDISRRILEAYLPRLSDGGAIEFIGQGLGRQGRATFVDGLAALLERHSAWGHVLLVGRGSLVRGDGVYDSTVVTTAMASEISLEVCYEVFELHFKKLGVDEIYTFFMRAGRGSEPARGGPTVVTTDLSRGGANWFV